MVSVITERSWCTPLCLMFFNLPFHDFREEDEESTADEEMKWRYPRARCPELRCTITRTCKNAGRWWCGERELNKQRRTVECAHSRPRLIVSQWHIRSSAGAGHRITIIAPFLADPPWNVHLWKADYRDSVTGFAENRSSTFLSSRWPSEEMCVRAISFVHVLKTPNK